MAGGNSDVLDASHQVIVLSFDLVDAEIGELPEQIAKALVSPQVQDSIKSTLLNFAKTRAGATTTAVSDADARKLFDALEKGVKDASTAALLEQIKKTPEYKKLEAGLENFKRAAESSALGVWVDKHKAVLYVVGAALVVGTGTVLYITKTGGSAVNMAVDPLKGKEFEVLKIGALKLKAGLWNFQPDARILGARVLGTMDWGKVSVDLKLGVLAQGADIQQVQGEAVVKSGHFSLSATGDGQLQTHQVNLGVKFGYDGVVGNGKFNIGVGAMYQNQGVSGSLNASLQTKNATFGLQGNIGPQKGGGVQYGGLLTVTIPL